MTTAPYQDVYSYDYFEHGINENETEKTKNVVEKQKSVDIRSFDTAKWNEKFQVGLENILAVPAQREKQNLENRVNAWINMSKVAIDFQYSASSYGRIIIDETFLPYDLKTIKPLDQNSGQWGIAGGLKYIVNGILFKYAVDAHNLFHGDNQLAAKIASHDLKSLGYYMWCKVPGIHFPMTMTIDYRGFRLVASAIIPINSTTMCYGSSSGSSVVVDDEKLAGKLKECAKKLNLKSHYVSISRDEPQDMVLVHSAVDLEGHIGNDGKYYILDFSRTFPPELPNREKYPGGHLYRLLRPEFVLRWKKPLSSDAFSKFAHHSPNRIEDNEEVIEATNYLYSTTIPEFSKKLEELSDKELLSFHFARLAHMDGINIRHFGKVRSFLKTENSLLSNLLLIEIASRIIKNKIRRAQEKEMQRLCQVQHWNTSEAVVSELNSILGLNEQSNQFWRVEFKELIDRYFTNALFEQELSSDFEFRKKLIEYKITASNITGTTSPVSALNILMARILSICNIRLREESKLTFIQTSVWFDVESPADIMDIEEIGVRVKHVSILAHSEGTMLRMKAMTLKAKKGPEYAKKLLRQAIEKFEHAVDYLPFNHHSIRSLAEMLDDAEASFKHSLSIAPNDPDTLYKYGYFLEKQKNRKEEGIHYYLKSMEVLTKHLNCMISLAEAYSHPEVNNRESALEWYKKAIELDPANQRLETNFEEFKENGKYCINGTCVSEDISFPLNF